MATSQIHAGKRATLLQRHELARLKALGPLSNPLLPSEQALSRTQRVEALYARLMASTREHVGRFAEAVRWQAPEHVLQAIENPASIDNIHQVKPGPAMATSGGGRGGGRPPPPPHRG